ncbi:sugar ABC transporter substrate-binding protein [Subtercola sp. YIM 133946]|uniref:sugar ABC transporter substrate-binding protein n=1 Tax=Subtercola sp. YIM 133946 TaxID=3118909 RepID=UPI002F92F09E
MRTRPRFTSRRAATLATLSGLAIGALALAGCSSDTGTSASTSTASAGSSSLSAAVSTVENPLSAYPVPTDAIADVSSMKGKTVYYIPITLQSPAFTVVANAMTAALTSVGATLQQCDGKGTPTDISACINQATQAGAAAIVTDAIPYAEASNAFDAAQAAGIPVIINNQLDDPTHPDSKTLLTLQGPGGDMDVALFQWFAQDSGGSGSLLVNQSTDGPSPAGYVATAKSQLATDCPGCTVVVNGISVSSFSLIPSSTSSALLQNPDVGYVEAQFDQYLQPTQAGVQQSGRTDIKGMTGAGGLGSLQALASNNFLYAVASPALAFQGWIDVDAAIRMVNGTTVPAYTIPIRLFTRDNISSVALTDAAQQSGEWFGPTTFTDEFKKLWGVN